MKKSSKNIVFWWSYEEGNFWGIMVMMRGTRLAEETFDVVL
jgi:hypothetical protein